MKKRIELSPIEIGQRVQTHLGHLLKSTRDYDQGDIGEAVRIAVSLRTLLHVRTRNGQAGISNLGGERWHFWDTCAEINPRNILSHMGLVYMQLGGGTGIDSIYQAHLDDPSTSRRFPFPEWWTKNVVLSNNKGEHFTRSWIVRSTADQEGAHIDTSHDESYHALNSGIATGWQVSSGNSMMPVPGLLRACTRQIAHEALRTFRKYAPNVFPLGIYPKYDEVMRFPHRRGFRRN